MTTVTPVRQPPLETLRNALDVCVCYEDAKNVSAESAQQQLPRIRALISQVLAQLGEPNAHAVERTAFELEHAASEAWRAATRGAQEPPVGFINERWARDSAAIILNGQVTWGIGSTL